jgi:DNA-directed RNA polymerase beta subunit
MRRWSVQAWKHRCARLRFCRFGQALRCRDQVDATRIVIQATESFSEGEPTVDIYKLKKFQRSNQNTCILQKPLWSK